MFVIMTIYFYIFGKLIIRELICLRNANQFAKFIFIINLQEGGIENYKFDGTPIGSIIYNKELMDFDFAIDK